MAAMSMLCFLRVRGSSAVLRRFYSQFQLHPKPLPNIDSHEPYLEMLTHRDYFNVKNMFSIAQLFEARVHFGHKISSLDDRMKPFVYGERAGHVIFNLNITAYHLQQALNFVAHVTLQGGITLFIARSPENGYFIEEAAKECGEYAHVRKWHEGTLLNIPGLQIGDVRLPDIAILLSTLSEMREQHPAVKECAKLNIPTVGIVDSNCNPNQICYPIPGNDDTYTSVELITNLFKEAILRGKRERQRRFDLAAASSGNNLDTSQVMTNIKNENKKVEAAKV